MRSAFNPMGATDMAKDYIVDYGSNSNGWWRKWKSGFIEQWGQQSNSNSTIRFFIPFSNTYYYINVMTANNSNSSNTQHSILYQGTKTKSSITGVYVGQYASSANSDGNYYNYWYAAGY